MEKEKEKEILAKLEEMSSEAFNIRESLDDEDDPAWGLIDSIVTFIEETTEKIEESWDD
jgi:hypothetical protein